MAIRFKNLSSLEQTTVDCHQGLNLLGHAQINELSIGSECGGHGVCGKDRVQISMTDQSFFSPPTEKEKKHLTEAELQNGWRLGCQCFPSQDGLDIEVSFKKSKTGI